MQDCGEKRSVGRPTIYTPELGDEICLAVSTTADGLNKLIERNPHWPSNNAIFEWRIKFKEFGDKYRVAKLHQLEIRFEELTDISDDKSEDYVEGEYGQVGNPSAVNRAKLRVDTRKWCLSKLLPKTFGDRVLTESKIDIEAMDKVELEGVVNALSNEAKIKLIEIVIQQVKDSEVKNDK